ncbi:GNAT family N-acetyltransferase [Aestuariimicrobium ganziense]|uniref:GNAT family N-acetyltransferase n=1 Tax=Aestuariimicrobium ganziense TaxID=2773677 RepID=UPI002E2865B1|nr:GNAT family N-acetyltransferase [Aestuariimicrobium ganziense]
MTTSTDRIVALSRPGRFRIRQAGLDDLPALAAVKALAWRQAYDFDEAVFVRQDELAARAAESWQQRARQGSYFWAVVDTQTIDPVSGQPSFVGIAHACAARDDDAPQPLELAMIYLLEVAKGSGIADRLLEICIGDAPAYLWVLEGNERAISFYRRHGFELDGAAQPLSGELSGHREVRMVRS